MIKVVIASQNPVKVSTTKNGFEKMFPDEKFEFEGVSADSNVSNQPRSNEETLQGATNRVENVSTISKDADYWVGIEGGVQSTAEGMEAFAWIVIKSKSGVVGRGRTGTFFLPDQIVALINSGLELGEADDIVFKKTNSKQANGAVGILTGDVLTRISFYEPAVVLALIPFKNPLLFSQASPVV